MTTEWTDAQIALTDIEEIFLRREKLLDTRHIELLRNLDRAVSESGEYCDRLVFRDGTSLALITDRNRRPPYLYGRWEIDESWPSLEEGKTTEDPPSQPTNWYYLLEKLAEVGEFPYEPIPGSDDLWFPQIKLNCYGHYAIRDYKTAKIQSFSTRLEAGAYLDEHYPLPPINLALQDKLMVKLLGSDRVGKDPIEKQATYQPGVLPLPGTWEPVVRGNFRWP
jgi:hypothetical protein